MRKEKNGWPQKVKVGHGTKASGRGLHPRGLIERLVHNESDLEGLDPKMHIVRLSGQLGEKRRLILLGRARTLNIHVANPGKTEARPVGEEAPTTTATPGLSEKKEAPSEATGEEEPMEEDLVQDPEPGNHRSDPGETER